ncbi:DinB family protein [Hymenobacter rigui]|uniref:DinB family protein n=1 Tax=Hymenobacter rigui TaxID=334424 RepID=A0A3R9MWK8_9BACT|nr:DinB family protein [Hymenobacter rigui]RSK50215.1 DinB family protein [Hymenobacter rigui]
MSTHFTLPSSTEYAPYYHTYVKLIAEDPLEALRRQSRELRQLLAGLTEEQGAFRYAPGKWSIKENLVHMLDTERIFAYRVLRIGRGDTTPLPGFEQDDYVPVSGADARSFANILAEYDTVRAATLSLLESFTAEDVSRQGTASGQPVSVRALAYILPGHEAHHLNLLRERYLPVLH